MRSSGEEKLARSSGEEKLVIHVAECKDKDKHTNKDGDGEQATEMAKSEKLVITVGAKIDWRVDGFGQS